VLILGCGYYHAATHGWMYVNLVDTSQRSRSGLFATPKSVCSTAATSFWLAPSRTTKSACTPHSSRGRRLLGGRAGRIVSADCGRSVAKVFQNYIDLVDRLGRSGAVRRGEVSRL
jgi:hypothetical protein